MNTFDDRARNWDSNPIHWSRSQAIADKMVELVPIHTQMKAMEYGAGTAILSFLLADKFAQITLMDNSTQMVNVMQEKVVDSQMKHLHPLFFDLEHTEYSGEKLDCVFTQMVMHHVNDVSGVLQKFNHLLNKDGYLVIADLYAEDGSFHGEGFDGHLGFDVAKMQADVEQAGFQHIVTEQCFVVQKNIDNQLRDYPVFIMVAKK